jgi:hypothetical protein
LLGAEVSIKGSIRKRKPRGRRELKISPESQKTLQERLESPEGQSLIDELARCFVQAAVTRLLKEQALAENAQASEAI